MTILGTYCDRSLTGIDVGSCDERCQDGEVSYAACFEVQGAGYLVESGGTGVCVVGGYQIVSGRGFG